jgi:hypothetical protein
VSAIVLEMGGSSDLCAHLQPGEPVVLMGPTGAPTEIAPDETVVLVGGGLGNAVLFSIGAAAGAAGSGAVLRRLQEDASTATRSPRSRRPPTSSSGAATRRRALRRAARRTAAFVGNIVDAMQAYAGPPRAARRSPCRTPTASSPSAPTA